MLARSGRLPTGGDYAYEVKWDGFRAIVFHGAELGVCCHRSLTIFHPSEVRARWEVLGVYDRANGDIGKLTKDVLDLDLDAQITARRTFAHDRLLEELGLLLERERQAKAGARPDARRRRAGRDHDWNADLHGSTSSAPAPDCMKAVRLLDKSTIDTGKKMASNATFNLAAQLLAADLSIKAGALTCPSAVSAVTDAQTLLAAVHFNGITHDKLGSAQTVQANTDARLDAALRLRFGRCPPPSPKPRPF
jgi:hypothetical protein